MGGSVTVGGTAYPVSEWSISLNNDTQDVTDTGSNGWQVMIAGINSAELTFRAFWGSAVSVLSTTFAIGTKVSVTLAIGAQSSPQTVVGDFWISSFSITNNAKTPVEFQCTGKSSGSVTLP